MADSSLSFVAENVGADTTEDTRECVVYYFKRHWDEKRGGEHDDWGTSTWYFETETDMWPTRQIEAYANGRVLHYDRQHIEDEFGGLSEAALDATEFAPFAIAQAEFEQEWNSKTPFNS